MSASESDREEISHEPAPKKKTKFRHVLRSMREEEKNHDGPWNPSSEDLQDETDDAGFVVARTRHKKKEKPKKFDCENEENESGSVKSRNSDQEKVDDSEPKNIAGEVEQLVQVFTSVKVKIPDAKRTDFIGELPSLVYTDRTGQANQFSGGQIDSKICEAEECSKMQGPADSTKKKQAWLNIPREDPTDTRVFHCEECTICLAPLSGNDSILLRCKHSFHSECIHLWMERKKTCPYCGQHSLLPDEFPRLGET